MNIFEILFHRGNDLTSQFLPDALFFKNSLLAGKFPIWNPWIFGGMPYFLDPQNFLWYPPNYLLLFLPLELGFLILLIGHLLFAGWMVKKTLGSLGNLGYLGGLLFAFSPKMVSHLEEGNWSLLVANWWLSALYWALKNKRKWWTIVSLSAIIINNLNIGYYAVLFAVLYLVVKGGITRQKLVPALPAGRHLCWRGGIMGVIGAIGALTVPRWLPLVLWGNLTVRANLNESVLPFWSWTKIIKSLTFPLGNGHPLLQNEEILYLGMLSCVISLIGLIWLIIRDKKEGKFWLIWLAFILAVALNVKTPLFNLMKWLPGFSLLRVTTRPWIFIALAVALAIPLIIRKIWGIRRNWGKTAAVLLTGSVLLEIGVFDWRIFERRKIIKDSVPESFYRQIVRGEIPVRAYCTIGCIDRLKAQKMGIALLGGNNPVQLIELVNYLQKAGGYEEKLYHPILPPYTVFSERPQPNAERLGQTATKFVISPYKLSDRNFELVDNEDGYYLYKNIANMAEYKDHYFRL